MANSDKNIKITPNISQTAQPNVVFTGQGNVPITLKVLDDSFGTLSFEGSAGQLFSINNNLTSGVIFAVNDVSGIPQIDVNADGTIRIAPFAAGVQVGGHTLGRGTGSVASNVVFGVSAFAACTTGASNTAIGQIALANLTTGNNNTGIGSWALGYITTTSGNISLGAEAGRLNVSGAALTGVTNSIYIGYLSIGNNSASNEIAIGTSAAGKGSNTTVIGNTSTVSTDVFGTLTTTLTAAAQKGLIVKGFTSQSANLQEWQNSAGTALASVDSSGIILTTSKFVHNSTGGDSIYLRRTADSANMGTLGWESGNSEVSLSSNYSALNLNNSSLGLRMAGFSSWTDAVTAQSFWIKGSSYLIVGANAANQLSRVAFNTASFQIYPAGGNQQTVPVPTSMFEVYGTSLFSSRSASAVTSVVKGFTSQSANLQEWQNSAGTVLSNVKSTGEIIAANGLQSYLNGGSTNVVIGNLSGDQSTPTYCVAIGQEAGRKLIQNTVGIGYRAGSSVSGTNYLLNPSNSVYIGYLAQGGVNTGFDNVPVTNEISIGYQAQGKGNNTTVIGNTSTTTTYLYGETHYIGGVAGTAISIQPQTRSTTGAGANVTIAAGAGVTTGAGGSIILQPGAQATSGGDGKVIVKGATSGTANLQEWQNSAGTVLASVDPSGRLTIATNAASSSADLYINNSGSIVPAIKWNYASGALGLRFYSGASLIGAFQDNGAARASSFQTWNAMNLGDYYVQRASAGILSFNSSGPAISVGAGTFTTADSTMQVTTPAASKKGLVVVGVASQTGNLQEWQNSGGTALAYVNSAGDIVGAGIYGSFLYAPTAYTDYWRIRSFYRAAPTTVGNYIEICSIQEGSGIYEIYATSEYGAGIGTTSKKYTISNAFGAWTGTTLTPRDIMRQSSYTTSFDFELELHRVAAYDVRLRLRRTAGTSARYVTITVQQQFLNSADITALSGTGTSPYGSLSQAFYIAPSNYALPVPGGSGAGNGIAFYAGAGETTGAGGSIILQAGAQAGGASVGGSISLVPSVSPANYAASYVGIGYLSGFTPAHYTFQRTLPDAVGDYVELFSFEGQHGSWFEITLVENKHAEAYGAKSYKFAAQYLVGNAILQPDFNQAENPGYASFFSNNYELELIAASDPATLRIRRSASGGTSVTIFVYVKAMVFSGLTEKTGTGTSAIALTSLHSTQLYSPTLIQPMRMPGNSGAGFNLTLKARDGLSTGAGGSIILQPGAQATSGGDGIVIVRQPGGTAGTDEIQLLHNGSRGSIINKDGALQLGGANIAIRNVANNANTTLTATTLYATGIYSSNVINADGVTSDSYSWAIDDSSFNWNQGFNLRVGWSHIRGYANCGIAYTGDNTNGRKSTLELTDGSTGGGAWAYRSATTTVNTSYNNLNLAGHSAFQRLNATAATTITGIAPASTAGGSGFPTWIHTDGRIFWLYNIGTFNITLANESASSTAGNRIITQTGADVILGPGRMMQIVYDNTSSRWRTGGETTIPAVSITSTGTAPPPFGALVSQPGGAQSGSTLTFSSGVTVETFVYSNGPSTTLTISNLASVRSTFTMNTWPNLTSLSFPTLNSVGVNFAPGAMSVLTTLSVPVLTFVGGNFQPTSMALTTLNLPALAYVGGTFGPGNMTSLTTLSTPVLATVINTFSPGTLNALTAISLPALTYIGGSFNPNALALVTTMSIPVLEYIAGSFLPSSMAALTTLSAPALKSVGVDLLRTGFSNGNISPGNMGLLATLTFPAIEVIGAVSSASISITFGTAGLTTFTLGSTLLRVEGNVIMSSCALNQASVDGVLVRLAALNGTGGTTTYSGKTVTITGASATPSATGLSAKSTLVSRGCTVTHN